MASADYDQVAAMYHAGRDPLAQPGHWGRLVAVHRAERLRVLDLGAGTGIFTRT